MRKENKIIVFLVILALLIVMIWVGIFIVQHNIEKLQLREEKFHNLIYLDLLKQSVINNIFSTEKIEDLFYNKLSAAVELARTSDKKNLTNLTRILELEELAIINSENEIVASSQSKGKYQYDLSLLELKNGDDIILELPAPKAENQLSLFYILKADDNYYLSSVSNQIIKSYIRSISLNSLIDFARATQLENSPRDLSDIHIKYIAIQDTLGILAATENVSSISRIKNDDFLIEVVKNGKSDSRIIEFENSRIIETVMPFQVDNYDFGIIRVGTHLTRIEAAAKRRNTVIIMFSIVFIIFLLLEYIFYTYFIKYKKSVENLNAALRFKEIAALGGEVAHEIKNPLNSVNMILQRIRNEFKVTENEAEYNRMLDISRGELARLNKISETFLNYTKLIELDKKPTNISRLLFSVQELFAENMKQNNIELILSCDFNLIFNLDNEKIKQVLINLVKNSLEALKNTHQEKKIQISAAKIKDQLEISVEDNGPGIAQENIDQIWDIYFTTRENGTGIGLSLSRKIVEAHNGEIELMSREEIDTKVVIRIPNENME
jgi:signal transduction histidine kinase